MGENEQGGMLRVVVVVGLVAIIAAAMIGGVMTLRGKMDSRNSATTDTVQKAIDHANDDDSGPSGPVLATDSIATANAKLKKLLVISKDNEQEGVDPTGVNKHPQYDINGDEDISKKTKWSIGVNSPNNDKSHIEGSTIVCQSDSGGYVYSPMIQIPKGASSMTVSYSGANVVQGVGVIMHDSAGQYPIYSWNHIYTQLIGPSGGSSSGTASFVNGRYGSENIAGIAKSADQIVLVFGFYPPDPGDSSGTYKPTLSNVQVTFS